MKREKKKMNKVKIDDGLHFWKPVKEYYTTIHKGEFVNSFWFPYRVCEGCGIIEKFDPDGQDKDWVEINKEKAKILKQKLVDKGDYFEKKEVVKKPFKAKDLLIRYIKEKESERENE